MAWQNGMGTIIQVIKGCRDDTVPKLLKQEGIARRIESMQQFSATPQNQDVGRGLWKIVACSQSSSQCFLVSTVLEVSSLHPTSFLMVQAVYTYGICNSV